MKQKFKMIVAGGKTGGHLFPGIAIAQAVLEIKPDSEILFVGTEEPFETRTLSRYGFAHEPISSAGIKGKGILDKIKAVFQIPRSIIQAVIIIRRFNPDIVIGVGGFSSGPVVLGAKLCRVKTAIQEQNSIAGITNRILAHFVNTIFTSFKETKRLTQISKMVHTGNPIRKDRSVSLKKNGSVFLNNNEMVSLNNFDEKCQNEPKNESETKYQNEFECRNDPKKFTILVTGGSQGAKSINTAFLEALQLMKYRERYRIIHQTGAKDEERVLMQYKNMAETLYEEKIASDKSNSFGVSEFIKKSNNSNKHNEILVKAFFNELPKIQAVADLIICRSGAGTISELTALGKAALLIPYPYAADDHQTYNAKQLADNGGAWMIPDNQLSGEILKEKIEFAYNHPDELAKMGQKAKEFGNPFADEMIASICIKLSNG